MPRIDNAERQARIHSRIFTPTAAQRPIWESNARIIAAIAGHYGGKTYMGPYWIMREAKRFPGSDFVICGPTYGTLRKAPVPKFLALMRALGLPTDYDRHSGVGYRPGDREYRLPQGGIVYFVTADRPGSMQGAHLRAAWIDETVDTSYEVYETLLGRVAGLQGRILITSTPYDLGWLYEQIYLPWKAGDPDIFVHQWRSIDNPKFSKDEFNKLRRRLPRWRFRMLYEGQFERPEGLVYDCFQDKHFIEPFIIPSDWERVLGIDWGFTDPMAAIWEARAPNGKRFLYDEFYRSGWIAKEKHDPEDPDEEVEIDPRGAFTFPTEMLEQIIERTKERQEALKAVYCDPSNAAMVAQAQQLFGDIGCYRVYGARNAILPGIDRCYGLVRKGDLFVFNTLTHFRDERARYQWKMDKNGEALRDAVPIDRNNHAMDAWRYLTAGGKDEKENTFGVGKIGEYDAFAARAAMREGY